MNSGYNAAQACLPLPGENIRRGIDAAEETHAALFIEQVKRRGEEREEGE